MLGKVLSSPRAASLTAHSAGRLTERKIIQDRLTWKLQISLCPASEYNLVFILKDNGSAAHGMEWSLYL